MDKIFQLGTTSKLSIPLLFCYALFLLAPFVDNLTGFLLAKNLIGEGSAGSPSQLFRLFMLFFSIYLLRKSRPDLLIVLFGCIYIFGIEFIWSLAYQNFSFFASGLVYSLKIIYLISVVLVFKIFLRSKLVPLVQIGNLFFYSIIIHALLIIIPKLLGVGVSTYGDGTFGTKGFFPSNNGLGLFCGIGGLFVTYWTYSQQVRWRILPFLVIAFGTILIGSKTALLLVVINVLYYYITIKRSYFKRLVPLGLFALVFLFFEKISEVFLMVFDVIVFRFRNSQDFSQFFFSSRDDFAEMAFSHCSFNGLFSLRVFFGAGSFMSFRNPDESIMAFRTLESDFLDIFFFYGVIGLIIYFIFFLGIIVNGFRAKIRPMLLLIWILLFSHSLLAGHILFNGMSILVILTLWFIINYEISMSNKELNR